MRKAVSMVGRCSTLSPTTITVISGHPIVANAVRCWDLSKSIISTSNIRSTNATTFHHYSNCPNTLLQFPPQRKVSSSLPVSIAPTTRHHYSTTNISCRYAVVDHAEAYQRAMQGRHGQQLALARLEGIGRDDPPYDPFLQDEAFLLQQEQQHDKSNDDSKEESSKDNTTSNDNDIVDEDDGYQADVSEDEEGGGDDDEVDLGRYNLDGSPRRKKSVLATLRAGYPAGGLLAVIELAGSQHKVTTDDMLVVNRLQPVDIFSIGSVHTLTDVLLVGSSHLTLVGLPYVTGAEVDVMVEEITQDAKVIVFKKRRRKHSQRKNGYRRDLTLLRVIDIRLPQEYQDHAHVSRDSVDELDLDRTMMIDTRNVKPTGSPSSTGESLPEDDLERQAQEQQQQQQQYLKTA